VKFPGVLLVVDLSGSLKPNHPLQRFAPRSHSQLLVSLRSGILPPSLPVSTRPTLSTCHSESGSDDETISAFFGCWNTAASHDVLEPAGCCAGRQDRRAADSLTGKNFADLVRIAKVDGWPGYLGAPRLARAAMGAQGFALSSQKLKEMALQILDGLDYRKIPRYADEMDPLDVAGEKQSWNMSKRWRSRNWIG